MGEGDIALGESSLWGRGTLLWVWIVSKGQNYMYFLKSILYTLCTVIASFHFHVRYIIFSVIYMSCTCTFRTLLHLLYVVLQASEVIMESVDMYYINTICNYMSS